MPELDMVTAWLVIVVVSGLIEMMTAGIVSIWFCFGALVAMLMAAFNLPFPLQMGAFLIVSALLLIFTRPIVYKVFKLKIEKTNADMMIGKTAIVQEKIDNDNGTGRVKVEGKDWSARTAVPGILEAGEKVTVLRIEGIKLIVEKKNKEK
jgi:membrane protein implicated in regulation of membrane protease activity